MSIITLSHAVLASSPVERVVSLVCIVTLYLIIFSIHFVSIPLVIVLCACCLSWLVSAIFHPPGPGLSTFSAPRPLVFPLPRVCSRQFQLISFCYSFESNWIRFKFGSEQSHAHTHLQSQPLGGGRQPPGHSVLHYACIVPASLMPQYISHHLTHAR